jgi:hypothetical protein
MFKCSPVVAALLVPLLAVSIASAAPPKKKKPKPKPADTTAAPAPTPPPPPVFDTKPSTSALNRVEASINSYSPKEAPPPTISRYGKDAVPTSTTTLTSADASSATPSAPRTTAAVAVADSDVASARPARRDPLGQGFTVAPLADFGTSKVYGFGVGARVGYTTASRIYLGGTFVYHLGESNGPLTYGLYYFGPEAGYNVPVGPIVVRPYVGGGYGALQTTYHGLAMIPGGGNAGTNGDFRGRSATPFVWPGLTIMVPVAGDFAVGADARVVFAPGQDAGYGSLLNSGTLRFATASPSSPPSTALAAGLTASYRF